MSLFVCFVLFLTDKEMWSEGDILSTLSVCQFSSISKSIGFTRGIKRLLSPAAVNHHHPLLWAYLSVLLHKPKNNCSVKTLKQTLQDKATNSSLKHVKRDLKSQHCPNSQLRLYLLIMSSKLQFGKANLLLTLSHRRQANMT